LDGRERVGADGAMMAEVEAEPIRGDERARLLHVLAQVMAERGVHEVRRRVVQARGLAAGGVDAEPHAIAEREPALAHYAAVRDDARTDLLRVGHLHLRALLALEPAPVADLAARLGVEGRLRRDDVDGAPRAHRAACLAAVDQERQDLRLPLLDAI